jgi:hypothetical protein
MPPSGITTRLVNLTNTHLEGVITLTNDVAKWGSWAGKITTGAESSTDTFLAAAYASTSAVSIQFLICPSLHYFRTQRRN